MKSTTDNLLTQLAQGEINITLLTSLEDYLLSAANLEVAADIDDASKLALLEKLLVAQPNSLELLLVLAIRKEAAKDHIQAVIYYRRAILVTSIFSWQQHIRVALARSGDVIQSITKQVSNQHIEIGIKHNTTEVSRSWLYSPRAKVACDLVLPFISDDAEVLAADFTEGFLSARLIEKGINLTSLVSQTDIEKHLLYEYPAQKRTRFRDFYYSQQRTLVYSDEQLEGSFLNELLADKPLKSAVVILLANETASWESFTSEQQMQLLNALIKQAEKGWLVVLPKSLTSSQQLAVVLAENKTEATAISELREEGNYLLAISGQGEFAEQAAEKLANKETRAEALLPPLANLQNIDSKRLRYRVELAKCRDLNGSNYTDWHYFVQTLKEYEQHSEYQGSALEAYYAAFQPKNRQQLYMLSGKQGAMQRGWPRDPWHTLADNPIPEKHGETRKGGNHRYGPNSLEFGTQEFNRLIKSYQSLVESGYQPEVYADGFIRGYFLLSGADYRFIICEGQHRIAALAALGHTEVDVYINLSTWYPKLVKRNNVVNFPYVKSKVYTKRQALQVFDCYFDSRNNLKLEARVEAWRAKNTKAK